MPDGFLNSAEFSVWASTMRLLEDEAHPVIKQSQFLTLPADLQAQVFSFSFATTHLAYLSKLIHTTNMQLVLNHKQFVFESLHMMSFFPLKENLSETQRPLSRELSLSEWRHWQHKSLPTHEINHSVRCQHFIEVMELIDNMKEENEVRIQCL